MSKKSGWLLGLLILTLAIGGLFSPANAMIEDIESVDVEGDGTNSEFGIPLVEVLIEGDTGENARDWLGTLQIMKQLDVAAIHTAADDADIENGLNARTIHADLKTILMAAPFSHSSDEVDNASVAVLVSGEQWLVTVVDDSYTAPDGSVTYLIKKGASLDFYIPEWLSIYEGSVADGDHELDGLNAATVDDASGFDDPNIAGTGLTDRGRTNFDGEYLFSCIVPPDVLPAGATEGFVSAFRFYGTEIGALEGAIAFKVQLPMFEDVDIDPDDVVRNGDQIELDINMEDADGDEIENCTLLPDFSNLDSAFHEPIETADDGEVYTNNWTAADDYGLDELVADVQRAVLEGRMSIEDRGNGRYRVYYTISSGNITSSGPKSVNVRAVAYPGSLAMNQMDTVYDAFGFDSSTGEIFMAQWTTGDDLNGDSDPDTKDIELDNLPPNFDFAMIDPFVTPKAMPLDAPEGEYAYIYKQGNQIRVMVQIDPHDLSVTEMNEVDPPDNPGDYDDGVIDLTVDDITVWGDFSALFTQEYLLANPGDSNGNGIPDVAESKAEYAGDNGDDDDWDGTEANVEDEEDSTVNGFNERFLYIFGFTVNEHFKGVSGIPATTGPLPIRFVIQDGIGNMRHYSAWREIYNTETGKWEEATQAEWTSAYGRSDDFTDLDSNGIIDQQNPILYDEDAGIIPNGGSFAHVPDTNLFPTWGNGRNIVENWNKPWAVIIDAAAPSVSVFNMLKMQVETTDVDIVNGAAVLRADGIDNDGDGFVDEADELTALVESVEVLGTGNFIYEITGDANSLVNLGVTFPSDNDVDYVEFWYSTDGVTYKPMRGAFGDPTVIKDPAGNVTDPDAPGANEDSDYHDAINGDDDDDGEADGGDNQVRDAILAAATDNVDNDADGLTDEYDVDANGLSTEIYDPTRDEDEDGIMDEDAYVVMAVDTDANGETDAAIWTIDPVRMARILNISPDQAIAVKAFAYDKAGNMKPSAAAPIYLIFRVIGPGVQESQGTAVAVIKKDAVEVTEKNLSENRVYEVEANTQGSAVSKVTFSYSIDGTNWTVMPEHSGVNPDSSAPFRFTWLPTVKADTGGDTWLDWVDTDADGVKDAGESGLAYEYGDDLFIRATPGKYGNLGRYDVVNGLTIDEEAFAPYAVDIIVPAPEGEEEADIVKAIVSATFPVLVMTQAGVDMDLSDGALIPVAEDVILKAVSTSSDVAKAVFQYAVVYPDGSTATWQDVPDTADLTILPGGSVQAVSKWDTTGLAPGRYDLRCVATNSSNKSNAELAPIAHVVVGRGKYAAFIIDPVYGDSIQGLSSELVARIYGDWANVPEVSSDIVRVIFQYRKVGSLSWLLADSVNTTSAGDVNLNEHYADWRGTWDLLDLNGEYYVKAMVEDDKGYVNDGIEIKVTVAVSANLRAQITNFASSATQNPRVSMQIARDPAVADIYEAPKSVDVAAMKIYLNAGNVVGGPDKVTFEYRVNRLDNVADPKGGPYKDDEMLAEITDADVAALALGASFDEVSEAIAALNAGTGGANWANVQALMTAAGVDITGASFVVERTDKRWTATVTDSNGHSVPYFLRAKDGDLLVYEGWVLIGTDTSATAAGSVGWNYTWTIDENHELHNLDVATLVYVRARAQKGNDEDAYADDGNFIPFVGMIFEETIEPTTAIELMSRGEYPGGVDLNLVDDWNDMDADGVIRFDEVDEKRITRGAEASSHVLSFVVSVYDNHPMGNSQLTSAIAKVELFYKLCKTASYTTVGSVSTLNWILGAEAIDSPFVLNWDVADLATGRYEFMIVATDQAGNRSSNPWNDLVDAANRDGLRHPVFEIDSEGDFITQWDDTNTNGVWDPGEAFTDTTGLIPGQTRFLSIDYLAPLAFVEEPCEGERLPCDNKILLAATSYTGCVDVIELQVGTEGFAEDIPVETETGDYVFVYQDLNKNGQWDPGEPWRIEGLPTDTSGGEWQVPTEGEEFWYTIGTYTLTPPTTFAAGSVSSDFAGQGYYYYDKNENGRYDVGEYVWQDKTGGNPGRYNNSPFVTEPLLMGSCIGITDELDGARFEDIPPTITNWTCVTGVTKWADIDGYDGADNDGDGLVDADDPTERGLGPKDFIWVDLDGDDAFDSTTDGLCEPVVYVSKEIVWTTILDLPPTNDTEYQFRVRAADKKDSAGDLGNMGLYTTVPVRVSNIAAQIYAVNGRAVAGAYDRNTGSGGQFVNQYQRVTGDEATVVVRVWPEPREGATVTLWYRYDNDLYPSQIGDNLSTTYNSAWDGIDNDGVGGIDDLKDNPAIAGTLLNVPEKNAWMQANITNVTYAASAVNNYFDATLTWDLSGFNGEFQYELIPVVIDGAGKAPVTVPLRTGPTADRCNTAAYQGHKIIIDHQGPYTFTQIVKNTSTKDTQGIVKSFSPLDVACGVDKMIIRTNDGVDSDADGYKDEPGEDNYKVFDVQAKVVSIYGGLEYTKTFDTSGGVQFEYRVAGGAWMPLGVDYEPDYMSTFESDGPITIDDVVMVTERGYFNDESNPLYATHRIFDMVPYAGWLVNSANAVVKNNAVAYTQRIAVTTWSLDNINISNTALFPPTNGTEYEFRTIAKDLPDVYGGTGHETDRDPAGTSRFDEYVVENRVGDGKKHADATQGERNFLRDINWKVGVPFGAGSVPADVPGLFVTPDLTLVNYEYVTGPGGLDKNYMVNNLVPAASIFRVDETVFGWTPAAGIDTEALNAAADDDGIHVKVHEEEQILFEAIVNANPDGAAGVNSVWGTGDGDDATGDITQVWLYARPYPQAARLSSTYYKSKYLASPVESNGWMKIGLGDLRTPPAVDPNANQSDQGVRYTFRVDTGTLIYDVPKYYASWGIDGTRDFQLMAMAIDKDCNAEGFLPTTGEIVIRVLDMMGPSIKVGGLALDMDHYKAIVDRLDLGVIGQILQAFYSMPFAYTDYLDLPFTDMYGLDANNFSNGVFPANPHVILEDALAPRNPLAKVSGELLQLYATSDAYADVSEVKFSILDSSDNNALPPVVVETGGEGYSKDTLSTAATPVPVPGTINHTFFLSEQTALIYLPTWTDVDGNDKPRFERVWLCYTAQPNVDGVGSAVGVPDPGAMTRVLMTQYHNSMGESVWKAEDISLKLGWTYFYYFLVDTVGHTWTMPDPKNLMIDEFLSGASGAEVLASLTAWLNSAGSNYSDNLYHNLPVISKMWVPGTSSGVDDEIWVADFDLDALPDGVYEVRVEATDKMDYKKMVSKTIVLDRTAPAVENIDLKVADRIKAGSETPLVAIVSDGPGINAVETVAVIFEISRKGNPSNTNEAVSTWQYALSSAPGEWPPRFYPWADPLILLPQEWQDIIPTWIGRVAIDTWPDDGWTAPWQTPNTDQNVDWYVRAVPFDDALNVQVGAGNQKKVTLDGTTPKAKIMTAQRAGESASDANGFMLYPDDTEVKLSAKIVANADYDLSENVAQGVDGINFEYTLQKPVTAGNTSSPIQWIPIPASQYSTAQRVPTADGQWQVTWYMNFSQIVNETKDQYIELRARAKDKVGNEDNEDPIHTIMILNNTTGPQAYIRFVDGSNVLDPHLAVTKRTYWPDDEGRDLDPGAVDVEIDAHKVAIATLEYRGPYTTSWSALEWMPVGTEQVVGSSLTMEWIVATLAEGRYQLRVTGFDGDGNSATEPDVVVVIVDHTEPDVKLVNMWVDVDTSVPANGFESKELIYPASGDSVYRYMAANGDYYDVKVTVKADATDPVDQVEAESVVLQYFHKASASWKTVPVVEGDTDGIFTYSKTTDLWTATFVGKKSYPDAAGLNVLGMLFAQGELNEGEVTFRALVTDYAGNQNSVEIDKDAIFTVIADAYGPNILAVYSGGRAYEGGRTTQVACSGDAVDLWVKVEDAGAGVASVKFYIPASPAAPTASSPDLPVPASSRDYIGAGELASPISGEDFSSVGGEELWHLLWVTPLDQNGNNFPYNVHVIITDKAGNTTDTRTDETLQARLIVEKDCKIPDAPQIVFAVTHAGAITGLTDPAQILDDTNACNYGIRKLLPIGADTNLDSSRADKYEVFDLYNKWPTTRTLYIHDDQYDTSLEIWVRTPDLEYGLNDIGTVDTRQYENYNSGTALPANTTNTGPSYLKVAKGALKRDPGLVKVYVEAGYDPNQDGDYSDVVWKPLDANTPAADKDPRTAITTANPFDAMPLSEVVQVKLYGSDAKVKGFAYYWVLGDTIGNSSVWNTEATTLTSVAADKGKVLDPIWGKDGIHFIRARAVDASGNVGEYGYQKILVHNQDDIKPAGTFITHVNGEVIADAAALEWKWHEVVVETRRNTVGYWSFGDGLIGNTYNKFFCDINNIVVEIFDADCGVWTNVTQYLKSTTHVDNNTWKAYIDSTLVADGYPQIRAYAVDNGGRFNAAYPVGDSNVYKQRSYPNTEDVDSDLAVANRKNVHIDNPHAKVVEPGVQATVERGDVLTIRAMEVADGPDESGNGHDVGQVVFLARRKAAPNGGIDGPWIVLDALDTDLDGEFGDDPVEPSDTNQPYMVHWRIPDWLLIDDPKTERTLEETAEYYVVAVAGDANTGPLDKHAPDPRNDKVDNDGDWTLDYDREPEGVPGHGEPSYAYEAYVLIDEEDMVEGGVYFEVVVGEEESIFYEAVGDVTPEMNLDEADEFGAQIHWDNPWHIVKCTSQYQLVTVQDTKPPRTRVLQVGQYSVPSETKIKVGKTVTVQAGDTEVDWVAPGTFVSLEGTGAPGDGLNPYAPGVTVNSLMWPAHNAAWTMGMLYPLPYDPEVKPEMYLVNEWRPNNRVTLRYAGPFAADAEAPAFPDSGETWQDKGWETAEADAIHLDNAGDPGRPKWKVTNWVTGGILGDGKYFVTVTATDDVGHTTGELYPGADRVTPDVVDIWVQNEGPAVTLSAAQLDPDGELNDTLVNNGEMERGRPLVLYLDPDAAMPVADLDKVTFMYKAAHDYDYTVVVNNSGATFTQPYSVILDPRFAWSGVTDEPGNLVLGAEYWFKAVAEDNIGNKKDSNVIKLVVVDREATASIAMIQRLDGYNGDEQYLWPRMILDEIPRLTGRVYLTGFTDADVVGVTFMYKLRGASWDDAVEIEAILNNDWSTDGRDNDGDWVGPEYYDGEVVNWHDDLSHDGIDGYYRDASGNWHPEPNVDEEDEGWAWDTVDWLFDGIDNDNDGEIDEAGECGYHYRGQQNWSVLWDTTVVKAGVYELAVVANTGENKSDVSDSLAVVIDHNAYDIMDLITEWQPTDDDWVGGWSRRPVQAENPILDPDDKLTCRELGEVDVFIAFEGGLPSDLDMGIPTGVIRDDDGINNNKYDDVICDEGCKEQTDEFDENLMEEGTALDPAVSFEWKESSYPDIGDENVNDKPNMDPSHWYWKPLDSPVVYDAATGRFTAVWHTVADEILNGYYDVRVRIVDEAGNVAYRVIAQRVVVDNTGPDSMITNLDGDTSLTYIQMATDKEGNDIPIETDTLATDTEIANNANVVVKATVRDSLTAVAYVQFQVRMSTLQSGAPLAGNRDELNLLGLDLTEWTDLGLASETPEDPEHPNSYALHWNTTGLLEGDYLLRLKSTDVVGNKSLSNVVKVTVVDTTPPIATIVGYYPEQYQFLHALWPQKSSLSPQKYYNYMLDNIYAATIGQSDIQEVQIQYRREGVGNWVTIGVPTLIPFENLDTPADKLEDISEIWYKKLYPDAVRIDEAILEAFDWTGLWGTTWKAEMAELEEGAMYELRAVAKDWSGNVAPELAPILKFRYENGVVNYEPDPSGMEISFTADIGGTGLGDSLIRGDYKDSPSVVVSVDVESGQKPTVLVLVEVDSPEGLVYGGEIIDVWREEGAPNRFNGVLDGEGLTIMVGNRWERLPNYLELIRLGGKITVFASTPSGMTSTVLTMDDLKVYPVTAELGTNGTVKSKDGALSIMVPRAALYEEDTNGKTTFVERAGLMITPSIKPNTPKDQKLTIEAVGQAYAIEFFNYLPKYLGFRPGFEPLITIDYSNMDIPPADEALGFISVRYWDPQLGRLPDGTPVDPRLVEGRWANDNIINLRVDPDNNTLTFNLKGFADWWYNVVTGASEDSEEGSVECMQGLRPNVIFSIVLEKTVGRVGEVVFWDRQGNEAYVYPSEEVSYLTELAGGEVGFRISDPSGIDENSIRVYIDGELFSVGIAGRTDGFASSVYPVAAPEDINRAYVFEVPGDLPFTEGFHTLRIEAWDKSDDIYEENWLVIEKTVEFYIDRTTPLVVTHAAQKDGVRWFSTPQGAVAAVTIVDEGVGLSAAQLQKSIFVDVFEHLNANNTPMRTQDQGEIVNFQRKVLITTSRPILEYADDYTPDGIDNETWIGIYGGASEVRHQAWRASYTIHSGEVNDGDTYEVVFYASKNAPRLEDDWYNENAIYLYEDLTNVYLMAWNGEGTVDAYADANDGWTFVGVRAQDYWESDILDTWTIDPFTNYYRGTFLVDILGNDGAAFVENAGRRTEDLAADSKDSSHHGSYVQPDVFFVRNLVADTRPPIVDLRVPTGVRADDLAATVSVSVIDDASGIEKASLIINGKVVAEKVGPSSSASLDYTFGKGEAASANEIKVVATDMAGNEIVERAAFGVQETDSPVISGMAPEGNGIKDATPTIAASYSDASGIDLSSVTLTLNGAVITGATIGESMVSYTPVEPLETGVTYTVKLAVKDKAGAASEKIWTFALETEAPSITDTKPAGVDETGTPVISAKFSDAGTGIDKSSAKLLLDSVAVDAEVTSSTVTYKPSAVMTKGKHSATLSVADVAGNVAELTWEFSIETTAPSITDVKPSGVIYSDTPILSASFSDSGTGINLSSVVLSLDGESVKAEVTESTASYGVKEPLKTGISYTVGVTVADKAGNVATTSRTFTLETAVPVITAEDPKDKSTVNSVDVAISANYSDGSGVGVDQATALMKVDGVAVGGTPSASGISYLATGLTKGNHTVYVEVADQFGNVGYKTWSFIVEQTPPTISKIQPSGSVNTATPVVSAAYSDAGTGIDVSSVVISLNGQVLPATVTASEASFEVLTPLKLGVTYSVAVQVADKAGNIQSGNSTFSLETTPPKVSSTKPTGTVGEAEAASGIVISAELSDTGGSGVDADSVVVWVDGGVVNAEATVESIQYIAKGLGYGEHTVRLLVADMLGNSTDEVWKFSVADSTPPTVMVLSPKQDSVVGERPLIKISYADEGSGVDLASISVKVDDKPVMASAMAPAGAKVVAAGEASYEVKLGYGAHTLTVELQDVAGNKGTAEVKFIVEGDALKLVKPHNYPNPFGTESSSTKIVFGLSQSARVTVRIYDFTATLVATVVDDELVGADENVEISWNGMTDSGDGDQLANGVYFCNILAKTGSETKSEIVKIALVRE